MYQESLEIFAMHVLKCRREYLNKLDEVYSLLTQDCNIETDKLDLTEMLTEIYKKISSKISDELRMYVKFNDTIEFFNRQDDNFVEYKIEGKLLQDLLKISKELEDSVPNCKDLENTKFNNVLDRTIDFDSKLQTNLDYLLQYLYDSELITL